MDDERIGQPVGLSSLLLHMGRKAADTQLSRGDITQDEYDEIIKILYPPLSLVDDKKNGGIPSFRSGAATVPYFRPGSTMYKPAPVPYFKELMAAQALLGGAQLMNNAASVGNIPGVTTGDTLDPDEVERKRKERQAALDEARRNKTSAAVADGVRDAADRGEYGDINYFGQDVRQTGDGTVIGPDADAMDKERAQREAEARGKLNNPPVTVDIPNSTGSPPPEIETGLPPTSVPPIEIPTIVGGGFPLPEIEDFTILTMGDTTKDTVTIAGKTYKKDQTEIRKRKSDGRTYRVVKDEFKSEAEKKRIADGKTVREELPQFLEDNPAIKDRLYTSSITGKPDLEIIRQHFIDKHGIDFQNKTYEKIVSQEIGNRKKDERKLSSYQTAQRVFEKNIRQYANDLGIKISKPQMDRYDQDFRIAIRLENPDKVKGEAYSEENIRAATNVVIDTIMRNEDPYLADYIKDKIQRTANNQATLLDKRRNFYNSGETLGHTGSIADGDVLFGEAANPERYTTEISKDNLFKDKQMAQYKEALAKGNTEKMNSIESKLKERNLRAMYIDEDGSEVYIGAPREEGKLKDGGPPKFAEGSRLNDYDPYDINQFQMGQLPSYESLYSDQGKFPVDQNKVDEMRAAALAEGKKFYGDATGFEIFKEGLFNLPDGVINYFAGSAEGMGELLAGLFEATKKGAQIQTFPTDKIANPDQRNISKSSPDYSPFSEEFQALLDKPAFTKYFDEFRGKIPTPNLAESTLSGITMDELGRTAGYYTGPPTAVLTAPGALAKYLKGSRAVDKPAPISEASRLSETEEVVTPTGTQIDETVEVTDTTKQVADPEIQIEKPRLDPAEVERVESLDTYIVPRFSKIEDYVQTKYAGSASKTKKKLSQWKKEMEDGDGAGALNEMKDTGMSFQISNLIKEGGDQTIDALTFLKIGQDLLQNNNQIKRGYSEFYGANQLGKNAGAAKVGNEITPEVTRGVIRQAKQDIVNVPITATGNSGRVLQEYKMAVQSMINELETMAGGTSKRTFAGVEDPSVVIQKYTSTVLPNILRKANNPNINLLYTEAQKLNDIVNRFKRLNINPRLTDNFKGTGWPGTRTEDYTIMEQGFDPKKGQSSRHEFHNSGHPNSDNSISFSRSIDKTTTDGRVTENIMEAQSDVHRGSTSYQSPEDIAGIDILENAEKKLRPQAEKALDDAWNNFSKDNKLYNFDTDPINMPISETVPDMFEVQLKAGSADNPIWEVINTRTKRKVPKKSFGTEDDAQVFADAKTKLEASKEAKKPKPTGFDVKVDQVSNDMYGENFKNLGLNQKQNVKRSILDNYGTVNQQMIDDANDFLSGLTQASKKELGKTKNPNFLNASRISKLNPGDSAFGNYDKFWSRKMSSGEDGQKSLLERIANQDLPRNTQSFEGLDRAVQNIKDLLDSSQGGQVRGGMFGGVDTFDAIKAQIVADTKMPIEEFLARLFPDEVKFAGSYTDISKNAKLRRARYESGSQDYPFKKQKDWVKNVLKSHIEKAISEGKTNVSWNPGEIVGVYESADAKDIAGYKTIYNKLMKEAAEDINKDLMERAAKLGLDPESARIKISGVGDDMNFTLQFDGDGINSYSQAAPDLVKKSFDGRKMEVSGLPYVDFTEAKDTIRKIGLPMHADGGRVGSKLPDVDEILGTI
jgi:hypothetical protein